MRGKEPGALLDRCLPPARPGLSLVLGFWAVSLVISGLQGILPLYGHLLSGLPALSAALTLTALSVAVALGVYRLRPWAWWGLVSLSSGWTLSTLISGAAIDPQVFYETLGYPTEWAAFQASQGGAWSPQRVGIVAVLGIASLAYLLFVRSFFLPQGSSAAEPASDPKALDFSIS